MRTTLLTLTLGALVMATPAAAQTTAHPAAAQPVAHKPVAHNARGQEIFVAVLSGAYEVPEVETRASGTAELTRVGSRLQYRVDLDGIKDVTGVYVHIGRAGEDTPAVADLFEGLKAGPVSGLLASGTLPRSAVHETTLPRLLRALANDDAYITVHTSAHPGGELRGQLRIQPTVASR